MSTITRTASGFYKDWGKDAQPIVFQTQPAARRPKELERGRLVRWTPCE